jgi:hypothetical protein
LKSPEPLLTGGRETAFLEFMESRDRYQVAAIEVVAVRAAENRDRILRGKNSMKSKSNSHAPEIDAASASPFASASIWSSADLREAIWDTLFAFATATAIYLGVASLARHLNEAQAARNAGIGSGKEISKMQSLG